MFKKPYEINREKVAVLKCNDKSLTKQSHKTECDINFIVNRFQKTGLLENQRAHPGEFADVDALTYHEAMNIITAAQTEFEGMPSSIRSRFGNDPAAFYDFVHDEKNLTAMREMGLLRPEQNPASSGTELTGTAPVEGAEVKA